MLTSAEEFANEFAMTLALRLLFTVSICLLASAAMLAPAALVMKLQSNADLARADLNRATGKDARRIVDAHAAPYSAMGRLKGAMLSTASVVLHPRIALTAAHCVGIGAGIVLQLGYQAGSDLGRFKATV